MKLVYAATAESWREQRIEENVYYTGERKYDTDFMQTC